MLGLGHSGRIASASKKSREDQNVARLGCHWSEATANTVQVKGEEGRIVPVEETAVKPMLAQEIDETQEGKDVSCAHPHLTYFTHPGRKTPQVSLSHRKCQPRHGSRVTLGGWREAYKAVRKMGIRVHNEMSRARKKTIALGEAEIRTFNGQSTCS